MNKIRVLGIFMIFIIVFYVAAAINSSGEFNISDNENSFKSIIVEARNSSNELFSRFNNNSEALSSISGLGNILGFVETTTNFMLDTGDKIVVIFEPIESVSDQIENYMEDNENLSFIEKKQNQEIRNFDSVSNLSFIPTVYVKIRGSKFNPSKLRIARNTTVRWTNKDSALYVINEGNFTSPTLNKYDKWDHLFNETGEFEYNCTIHPYMQKGKIIVD